MATITASLTLASPDLLTNALAFSTTNNLTKAGNSTGLEQTSGLARTNFTVGGSAPFTAKTIFRSDDATSADASTNSANKVYLKNLSTSPAEFFTVYIDQEEIGRLYAGDWAFFPWSAKSGTKETFRIVIADTWAAADTWEFDGVEVIAASANEPDIAAQIHAENFPNWTTAISSAHVTFTARHSMDAGTVVTATADIVVDTASDGSSVVDNAALGIATESDIMIVPSVATTMDLEHILFYQ